MTKTSLKILVTLWKTAATTLADIIQLQKQEYRDADMHRDAMLDRARDEAFEAGTRSNRFHLEKTIKALRSDLTEALSDRDCFKKTWQELVEAYHADTVAWGSKDRDNAKVMQDLSDQVDSWKSRHEREFLQCEAAMRENGELNAKLKAAYAMYDKRDREWNEADEKRASAEDAADKTIVELREALSTAHARAERFELQCRAGNALLDKVNDRNTWYNALIFAFTGNYRHEDALAADDYMMPVKPLLVIREDDKVYRIEPWTAEKGFQAVDVTDLLPAIRTARLEYGQELARFKMKVCRHDETKNCERDPRIPQLCQLGQCKADNEAARSELPF